MRLRVVFTVEAPAGDKEALRTLIAAAVTESLSLEVPGTTVRWVSIGGSLPEVVQTAQENGLTVREQQAIDEGQWWS